jgi:hypothetical protein
MRAMSSLANVPKIGGRVKAVARRRHTFIVECLVEAGPAWLGQMSTPSRALGLRR